MFWLALFAITISFFCFLIVKGPLIAAIISSALTFILPFLGLLYLGHGSIGMPIMNLLILSLCSAGLYFY